MLYELENPASDQNVNVSIKGYDAYYMVVMRKGPYDGTIEAQRVVLGEQLVTREFIKEARDATHCHINTEAGQVSFLFAGTSTLYGNDNLFRIISGLSAPSSGYKNAVRLYGVKYN